MSVDWGQTAGVVVAGLALLEGARRWVVKPLQELLERARLRDEDWNGVPARPGVPGRPGVMAELGALKTFASDTNERVTRLEVDRDKAHDEANRMWAAIEAVAKASPPADS